MTSQRTIAVVFIAALPLVASTLAAQQTAPADSLELGPLQNAAVARDPRAAQTDLLSSQSALRLGELGSGWLPKVSVGGQAQYQSAVPEIPFELPGSGPPFSPDKDTYDAHIDLRQSLYDPAISAQKGVERATLAEQQARVQSSLFALRQDVSDAFFGALELEAQGRELDAAISDLEGQLRVAEARVAAGEALSSSSDLLQAELLRRRESRREIETSRDATLAVLSSLTGRTVTRDDALAIPDLQSQVARARGTIDSVRQRPEYTDFARRRSSLAQQQTAIGRRNWPRLDLVGRAGYGRPGLNPLGTDFTGYWLVGVQLAWSPWDWGVAGRQQEALSIQQQIVGTEEAAFTERVHRAAVQQLATLDRMEQALESDSALVALHQRVLHETEVRFGEGVVTSAELIDRETDLLAARLARASHRIALAQARARFLTLLGIEVR